MSATAVRETVPVGPARPEHASSQPAATAALRLGRRRARRRSGQRHPGAALGRDAAVVACSMLISAATGASPPPAPAAVFAVALLAALHVGTPAWHDGSLLDEVRHAFGATTQAAVVLLATGAVAGSAVHAGTALRLWTAASGLLIAARVFGRQTRLVAPSEPRPTLIVDAGRVGSELAAGLSREPWHGLRPVAVLEPTLDAPQALGEALAATGAECVVFGFTALTDEQLLPLLEQCVSLRLRTFVVPRLYEADCARMRRHAVGPVPLAELQPADPRGPAFAIKHLIDHVLAAVALVLLAPLLVVIAALVRATSPGPALYLQRRVGRDGREFTMFKFRTMTVAADREPAFAPPSGCAPGGVEHGDRRTRLGILLRRSSIDELPQLFNVLRGDMSLIGPRPERPEYVRRFAVDVARYDQRHRVKSGITGLAQVSGLRGQTPLAERARYDNAYVENWSFWLDVKIAVRTLKVILTLGGS